MVYTNLEASAINRWKGVRHGTFQVRSLAIKSSIVINPFVPHASLKHPFYNYSIAFVFRNSGHPVRMPSVLRSDYTSTIVFAAPLTAANLPLIQNARPTPVATPNLSLFWPRAYQYRQQTLLGHGRNHGSSRHSTELRRQRGQQHQGLLVLVGWMHVTRILQVRLSSIHSPFGSR